MDQKLIPLRDVINRTSLSKTHTYRLINRGEFPRPVTISAKRIAFLNSEIDEWLQKRIDARGGSDDRT